MTGLVGALAALLACSAEDPPPVARRAAAPFAPRVVTPLGGAGKDSARGATADARGNLYLTGGTETPDFPTTDGAFDRTHNGWQDAWVAKLGPDGELLWCTLLGGPGYDRAYAVEVRADGTVVVAGRAGEGFPTTPGSLQPEFGGDVAPSGTYGEQDGFVAALSADGGELLWATYFGTDDGSNIRDVAVDAEGAVYLAADAAADHPSRYATEGAFATAVRGERDALVVKLAPDGARVVWGTYLGGNDRDGGAGSIRVDATGSAYYLGHTHSTDLPVSDGAVQRGLAGDKDLFLARLAPDGASLVFLTYLGGSGLEFSETHGLCLAGDGSAFVTATTSSSDLLRGAAPLRPGFQPRSGGVARRKEDGARTNYPGDGFAARVSGDGRRLLGLTHFGGTLGEGIEGSGVDAQGRLWVCGATYSRDLPVRDAWQPGSGGGADAFVAIFSPDLGELVWATYLGGPGEDFARCLAVAGDVAAVGGVTYGELPAIGRQLGTRGAESDVLCALLAPRAAGGRGE